MKEKRTPNSRISVQSKSTFSLTLIKGKKGFTLVELVVVIAILAILAAIAIPVVSYNIRTSTIGKAKTNAHTAEQAIKEAQALVEAKNVTKYADVNSNIVKVSDVAKVDGIKEAFDPIMMYSDTYYPVWCEGRVYFVLDGDNDGVVTSTDKIIDGTSLPGTPVILFDKANNKIKDIDVTTLTTS